MAKTNLKHFLELLAEFKPPWALNHQINWNLRDDDVDLFKFGLCGPPKPLHEYACAFSLKLPQFCSSGRSGFGKDPQCSYLLQVNKSFLVSLFGLAGSLDTHEKANPVSGNIFVGARKVTVPIRPLRNVRFLLRHLLSSQGLPCLWVRPLPIHRTPAGGLGSHRTVQNVQDPPLGHN